MKTEVYISRVDSPEGRRDYVSLLPPKGGLIAASIIGMFRAPESGPPNISVENFTRNGVFVDFLHAVIEREAPKLSAYMAEAKRVGNGPVYVIDRRASEDATIQPEDTFGAFEARNEQIVPEAYEANPTHRLLSERGFFQLEPELHTALLQELTALASQKE